jgi:IS1 family transposase
VFDFEISQKRDLTSYLKMAFRLDALYNVGILCTDDYPVYKQFTFAKKHVTSKAETSLVESKNPLIRHYLAPFNRKIKRFTKNIQMATHSIRLLFNQSLLLSIVN